MNKKMITFITMLSLASFGALAVWLTSLSGATEGLVVSSGENPLYFTVDLSDYTIDTTDTSASESIVASITNDGGDLSNMIVSITTVKTDNTSDTCTDYEADVTLEWLFDGTTIVDEDVITIPGYATTELRLDVDALMKSCPGSISSTISIVEGS